MLGDRIETLLERLGVTSSRVSKWLGRPCNCAERRDKLNALESLARRTLRKGLEGAAEALERILQEE